MTRKLGENSATPADNDQPRSFDGTTMLIGCQGTILLPKPSTSDARDPLNLPSWRKHAIIAILVLYAVSGLCVVTGLGALIVYITPEYEAAGISKVQISRLLTYPPLLLGVGNLISMPLAVSIGRRPVLLASSLLLIISSAICATSKTFARHLAGRILAGFAAAQCEAVVLLIISDISFLHQRGRMLQIYSSMEVLFNSGLTIVASYMANALGWQSWYWLFTGLSVLCFLLIFIFVPETNYDREITAYMGGTEDVTVARLSRSSEETGDTNYPPRMWKSDLAVFAQRPQWVHLVTTVKNVVKVFFFPHVLWVSLVNGLLQAIDISFQITYGSTLVSPPYNWANTSVSLIQLGQIAVALLCIPFIGQISDTVIQAMARSNHGIHEPEYRLIPLIIPFLLSTIIAPIYGAAIQNPFNYHWFIFAFTVDAWLYVLLAASTSGTTYLIDAHPNRVGAILVVIPVVRGLVSFGISNQTVTYIERIGALDLFGIYTAMIGLFAIMGVVLYFKGKRLRKLCAQWTF